MLVHQCDSCGKRTEVTDHTTPPSLPAFWSRITVNLPWGNTAERNKVNYDLCNECSRLPIKFGTIELDRSKAAD